MTTSRAGATTTRRGLQRVKTALLAPAVLLIIFASVVFEVIATVGGTLLIKALGISASKDVTAFVMGAAFATTVLVLLGVVVVLSGGVNWITGGMAERWTGQLLASFGHDWRVLHNLTFAEGRSPDTWEIDVDHVAVGPYGVLVVESKYSSIPIDIDAERLSSQLRRDAEQVQRNATRVKRVLRADGLAVRVRPVLVYWGWRVKTPERAVRRIGDVRVVAGADADRWRPLLAGRVTTREIEDAAWTALQMQAATYAVGTRRS